MKVILQKDIARVGKKFEVKDVPSGHAMNYLIPHKLAVPATDAELKKLAAMEEKVTAEHQEKAAAFTALLEKIEDEDIRVAAKENEKGSLFQAIREADIAKHLSEQTGLVVSEDMISLDNPIKQSGEHTITLVSGDQKQRVKITIVGA